MLPTYYILYNLWNYRFQIILRFVINYNILYGFVDVIELYVILRKCLLFDLHRTDSLRNRLIFMVLLYELCCKNYLIEYSRSCLYARAIKIILQLFNKLIVCTPHYTGIYNDYILYIYVYYITFFFYGSSFGDFRILRFIIIKHLYYTFHALTYNVYEYTSDTVKNDERFKH